MVPQDLIDYISKTQNVARHHEKVIKGTVYILTSLIQETYYLQQAIDKGAKYVIVSQELYHKIPSDNLKCEVIPVENPRKFWAYAASLIYPHLPKVITTVTGTSGKTSVAYMYAQAVAILVQKAIYIGTLGAIKVDNEPQKITDTLTTPDILDLRKLLSESQCEYAAIEASSHGISQNRLDYIPFKVAAFTNLAPEHLDYHKNLGEYFDAKKRLFTDYNINNFVLNSDDEYSQKLIEISRDKNIMTYGRKGYLQLIEYNSGCNFKLNISDKIYNINCTIPGIFNIYNILCVIGMVIQSGFTIDEAISTVEHLSLPVGRMQKITKNNLEIFIDYAHKPNALEAVMASLVEYKTTNNKGQISVVFGCGGDRDREKRSIMGEIASRFADKIIITDDNPRYENPQIIRDNIINGIKGGYIEIANRQSAIEYAIKNAATNDIILVAGKGHETYQIIGDKKLYFADLEVINNTLQTNLF